MNDHSRLLLVHVGHLIASGLSMVPLLRGNSRLCCRVLTDDMLYDLCDSPRLVLCRCVLLLYMQPQQLVVYALIFTG